MRLNANKLISGLFYLLMLPAFSAFAQTNTLSPYSRFGPGDLIFNGYANQVGMAGVSNAGTSVSKLNFNNPASYAYDTLMILDFNLTSERLRLKQSSVSNTQVNTSINNFSIGFPLKRGIWGMAFGFIPYSGIGYKIQTGEVLDSANSLITKYSGNGGYTRYYIGTGVKITKNLSFGVNANYLFGTVSKTRKILFTNSTYFSNRYKEEVYLADFYFEMGLNYNGKLNDKFNYSLGLTGSPAQSIKAKRTTLWENYKYESFNDLEVIRDTIDYSPDKSGTVVLPTKIGLGVQISTNSYSLGLDINWQDWNSYKVYGVNDGLKNSFKIALGGQWIPNNKSLSYSSRIQYRGGLYFNKTYLELKNTALNDYGVTIGAGLPFKKSYGSMFNFGFTAGKRGTTKDNLISEQYLRLVFGITLNEDWFRKSKYD